MRSGFLLEVGVVVLIIVLLIKASPVDPQSIVSPSDIICSSYGQCTVGEVTFNVGDTVTSPKHNFGFTSGEIIIINQDELTATIKWNNGRTTTDSLTELNKVKELV